MSSGYRGSTKGILSLAKAGGEPTKLADVQQARGVWVTAGQLYFYDAGPELFSLPKSGGKPVSIMRDYALGPAAAAGDTFCWVGPRVVDDAGRKSNSAASKAVGGVQRTKVLKSDERSVKCKEDGAQQPVDVAYTTLFTSLLLVAGDEVFWPSSLEGTLQAAAVAGGRERTVTQDAKGVTAIAANQSTLFFIGTHRDEAGLFAVGKRGGKPKKLAALDVLTRDLAANDANVYYALKGSLWRVPLRGGQPSALLQVEAMMPPAILVDESGLYLADGFYLRRLKR